MDWLKQVQGRFVLYRGLADAAWEVKSSAYRRIEDSEGEAPARVFQNYIQQLLNSASLQGFREREGVKRSDLELLAELQHNGAATCLIDFTSNALVALWIACREKPEKAGKVVAMATEETEDFYIVTYENLQDPINKFLNQGKLWKWTPSNLSNRIVAQNSVFVFGEGKIEERRYEEIRINRNSKQKIREELKEKFGISEESLFSDFTGFALSNAHDRPYSDYTAEDYLSLGLAFRQRGNFKMAKDAFDQAIKRNPQLSEAYAGRGLAKNDLGDHVDAITDYDKAIQLKPQEAVMYSGRGAAKYASKDFSGAIADFDQAIELNPQFAAVFGLRGITKHYLGDFSGAIADYDKVIDLDPQDADAYAGRGIAKRVLGDHQGAITDLDQAIELNPQSALAYNNRGLAKIGSGDHQGAIVDLDQAIELNPQYAEAYNNRGLAKIGSGDHQGTIVDFDQAISLNPQYAKAYNNRGLAKHALGDDAGAAADFAKAQELDPSLEPPEPA